MMIATLLVVGTINLYNKIYDFTKNNVLTSIITTFIVSTFFLFPMFYFINHLATTITHLEASTISLMINSIKSYIINIIQSLDINIDTYSNIINPSELSLKALEIGKKLGEIGVNFVADVSLIMIFYFMILIYKDELDHYFRFIIPFNRKEEDQIMGSLASTMNIVFNSTILTAFLEGVLFAIIMSIYGYNGFLFGMLYGFASLIPIVGGLLIWVPISLYELSLGHNVNAIVIAVYTILIISIIADTFIKPIIIKIIKENEHTILCHDIHEYVIFFSILAGMTSFGFWGIIIGPAVTTIFLTLIYIYSKGLLCKK
jgi:predicted PurR-regulated permease PerM